MNNSITQRYFTNCNFSREIDSGSSQSDISSTGFEFLEKKEISSAVRSNFNVSRSGTLDFNTSEGKKVVEQC